MNNFKALVMEPNNEIDFPSDLNDTVSVRLRKVLMTNRLNEFWALVKAGAEIDSRDRFNRTSLHSVIYWKMKLPVVKAVLLAGADPNAVDRHGFTPIHAAVFSQSSPDIFKALISAGAEIDRVDLYGRSSVKKCIRLKDNLPVARILLSAGAEIRERNISFEAAKVNYDVIKMFVIGGASVNETTYGYPPILYAIINRDLVTVKMLLSAGARIDFKHPESQSGLLHQASTSEIALELIKHGVSVNAADNQGETPLHRAVVGNNLLLVRTLIRAGANVHSVVTRGGNSCLHLAKCKDVIKELVSHGADINARNQRGESPLHTLITDIGLFFSSYVRTRSLFVRYFKDSSFPKRYDTVSAVREMIKNGADVNASDRKNNTVLELAVSRGHSKMISLMIKRGLEVCWKKLFSLKVINQTAMQLLIKESLLGNIVIKGENLFDCKNSNEKPFILTRKPLMTYTYRCLAEIKVMKTKKINCNNSMYYYVVQNGPNIKALRLCDHNEVLKEQFSDMFPILKYYVTTRLNQCYKRAFLLDFLEKVNINAAVGHVRRRVSLINDCKFAVAEYLSNQDLINFLLAMGFNISKNIVCPNSICSD